MLKWLVVSVFFLYSYDFFACISITNADVSAHKPLNSTNIWPRHRKILYSLEINFVYTCWAVYCFVTSRTRAWASHHSTTGFIHRFIIWSPGWLFWHNQIREGNYVAGYLLRPFFLFRCMFIFNRRTCQCFRNDFRFNLLIVGFCRGDFNRRIGNSCIIIGVIIFPRRNFKYITTPIYSWSSNKG